MHGISYVNCLLQSNTRSAIYEAERKRRHRSMMLQYFDRVGFAEAFDSIKSISSSLRYCSGKSCEVSRLWNRPTLTTVFNARMSIPPELEECSTVQPVVSDNRRETEGVQVTQVAAPADGADVQSAARKPWRFFAIIVALGFTGLLTAWYQDTPIFLI